MYDLTVGPKPADITALPVPEEGPAGWSPDYEEPMTDDALFTKKSFGVKQTYEDAKDGSQLASFALYGTPPADLFLQVKARRELVSGIFAQVAAAVATVDATHGTIALGGSGLTIDEYVGRVISKLANPQGSTALVPIQGFTVTANDATGTFTVTPDPAAVGCAAGDLFTLRTAPTATDATSYTDSKFNNPYNVGGLTVGRNRGNLALVIAGKGAGQSPQTVVDNTATKVTIAPGWDIEPDSTSVIVLVEAIPQVNLPIQFNGGATDKFLGNLPSANYRGMVVRIEGYTARGAVEGRIEKAPFREVYLWGQPGSSSGIDDGYYTLTPDLSGNVQIDLANGLNQRLVLGGTALTILPPIFTDGSIVSGAWFVLYLEQDGTGNRAAPTYDGSAGGFAADDGLSQVDGRAGIRTYQQFTYHAAEDRWGLDTFRMGVATS
jgi:hypothetical protein